MILAMDLSLSGSAFAVLDIQDGAINIIDTVWVNNKKHGQKPHGFRLRNIAEELKRLLQKHCIKYVVREKGFSRFNKTTQTLFKVVGVSDLLAFEKGHEAIEEITPTQVKKVITGSGAASKDDVEAGVRKFLTKDQANIIFETDDVSDAVAVGICYAIQSGYISRKAGD